MVFCTRFPPTDESVPPADEMSGFDGARLFATIVLPRLTGPSERRPPPFPTMVRLNAIVELRMVAASPSIQTAPAPPVADVFEFVLTVTFAINIVAPESVCTAEHVSAELLLIVVFVK